MARNAALNQMIALIPALILTAIVGIGSYLGIATVVEQTPGSAMSCKIAQIENATDKQDGLLIRTDGCGSTTSTERVFRADRKEFAASFTDPAFTVNDFYKGVAAGKTYNFTIRGIASEPLHLIPTVVKVAEDYMPY